MVNTTLLPGIKMEKYYIYRPVVEMSYITDMAERIREIRLDGVQPLIFILTGIIYRT